MNQRKKDIMKIRIIQAYAVCKAFLDAYRNEENLKSLEEFGDVVDEISAFVDAFDNSPLFQTLKDIRQIAYEKYQHDWMISHDIDEMKTHFLKMYPIGFLILMNFVMMDFQWRVRMKLSSSDGTQLTVDELREAYSLLSRCCLRIEEINSGNYKPGNPPVVFHAGACPELAKLSKQISEISEKLENLIHKK